MTSYQGNIPLSQTAYRDTKVAVDFSQTAVRKLLRKYDVRDVQNTSLHTGMMVLRFARPGEIGNMDVYSVKVQALTPDAQGERQAARMLYWWMKAMLETVAYGIADFNTAFLPYQLVAGEQGEQTVAEAVIPQLRSGATDIDPFRPALPSGESSRPALPGGS